MSEEPTSRSPRNVIPLCVPEIRGNEWKYVKECLDTAWVSSAGPFVDRFEREMAARVGSPRGVAAVNGTAALHIALLVYGIEPDDEVLVSSLTFVAPVNAIHYIGAWPVFIDSDPGYWQMDPKKVQEFLECNCFETDGELRNRDTGRRVRAILPVHILGHPVDLDPILALARRHELAVVEDATESLGAAYRGRPVGSLGDIGCFSFNGNKIITTGGGGMIVTASDEAADRARYLTTQAKDDIVESVHLEVGYNYRLTNIQAAMGCAQLENLDDYISAKRQIAKTYATEFEDVAGIVSMREAPWADSTSWLFTVKVEAEDYGMDSRQLMRTLSRAGIESRPLWQPAYHHPAYSKCSNVGGTVAEGLYRKCLSLPCSVGLDEADQRRVIDVIGRRQP